MHLLARLLRVVGRPLALLLAVAAVGGRLVDVLRRQRHARRPMRRSRAILPSLYDVHPEASRAARRPLGVQTVPLDRVVGTLRRPSQNTADFRPLPQLRGANWAGRWQRILRATDRLEMLPPVELVKVGDGYYIADGHNRVAAARSVGAVAIDADVTELVVRGTERSRSSPSLGSSLAGAEELRHAASGRHSRTSEHRTAADSVTRRDLLRAPDEDPNE